MTRRDPMELYRMALASAGGSSGYYNLNVRVDDDGSPVLVRIPIPGADQMDLRIWDESAVLRAIEPHVDDAPRVLFCWENPVFQVHEFVKGAVVDRIAPRGMPVPQPLIPAVLRLFQQLEQVPLATLPPLPAGWPADGDTPAFATMLTGVTELVFQRYRDAYAWPLREFGVPQDPLAAVRDHWKTLAARPFCLTHADVHRKNILVSGSRAIFLDWELALWGDPLYELAVHLHKIAYLPDEEEQVIRGWMATRPGEATIACTRDLAAYLGHERVKSAIVDAVRYVKLFHHQAMDTSLRKSTIDRYTSILAMAHEVWDLPGVPPDEERVEWVLQRGTDSG